MRTVSILFLFFSLTYFAIGQEMQTIRLQDTSIINRTINFNSEYLSGTPSLSLPLSLRMMSDSSPDYPGQSLTLSLQSYSWKTQQNLDLSSIWKREVAKQEEYKTLRMVMGSIQAGGAAYLAYLHFKKYGFK
jgi:hypothetical protein